jgi:hypothetical protein
MNIVPSTFGDPRPFVVQNVQDAVDQVGQRQLPFAFVPMATSDELSAIEQLQEDVSLLGTGVEGLSTFSCNRDVWNWKEESYSQHHLVPQHHFWPLPELVKRWYRAADPLFWRCFNQLKETSCKSVAGRLSFIGVSEQCYEACRRYPDQALRNFDPYRWHRDSQPQGDKRTTLLFLLTMRGMPTQILHCPDQAVCASDVKIDQVARALLSAPASLAQIICPPPGHLMIGTIGPTGTIHRGPALQDITDGKMRILMTLNAEYTGKTPPR